MSYIDEKTYQRILAKKTPPRNTQASLRKLGGKTAGKHGNSLHLQLKRHRRKHPSLGETRMVIREGLTVKGKSLIEHLEAKNHPQAITYIENLINEKLGEPDIREIHNLLFSGLCESPGNYRNGQVYIEGSDYMPPPAFEIPSLVQELIDWLNSNPEELRPIEMAAVFHHKLVAIHPFDDGNGRVGQTADEPAANAERLPAYSHQNG